MTHFVKQRGWEKFGTAVLNADGTGLMGNSSVIRMSYSGDNVEYIWETGSWDYENTDKSVWKIKKMIYDGSGNLTWVVYADWEVDFNKVWDDRTLYIYK